MCLECREYVKCRMEHVATAAAAAALIIRISSSYLKLYSIYGRYRTYYQRKLKVYSQILPWFETPYRLFEVFWENHVIYSSQHSQHTHTHIYRNLHTHI